VNLVLFGTAEVNKQ